MLFNSYLGEKMQQNPNTTRKPTTQSPEIEQTLGHLVALNSCTMREPQ